MLFNNSAEILLEALIEQEVLPRDASLFVDLRIRANGGRVPTLDEAIAATRDLVADVASATGRSRTALPAVVAGATVRIPRGVMLPEAILILDVLAIRTDGDRPELIVGDLTRMGELLGGAKPRNPAEEDLMRRIRDSDLMAGQ